MNITSSLNEHTPCQIMLFASLFVPIRLSKTFQLHHPIDPTISSDSFCDTIDSLDGHSAPNCLVKLEKNSFRNFVPSCCDTFLLSAQVPKMFTRTFTRMIT